MNIKELKVKTIEVTNPLEKAQLKVIMGFSRDSRSTYFIINYKGKLIASGHLNNGTNWAHVTMEGANEGDDALEEYLVECIEERSISIA